MSKIHHRAEYIVEFFKKTVPQEILSRKKTPRRASGVVIYWELIIKLRTWEDEFTGRN